MKLVSLSVVTTLVVLGWSASIHAGVKGEGYRSLQAEINCCGTGCVQSCDTVQNDTTDTTDAAGDDTSATEPKTVEIRAVGVKFEPLIAYAEAGDTIRWTNMAAHLVESIGEMSPPDLEHFLSELSVDYALNLKGEGIITYKCTPHWGARMGGFIVVGKPDNLEELLTQYAETANSVPELKAAKGLVKKLRKDLVKNGYL